MTELNEMPKRKHIRTCGTCNWYVHGAVLGDFGQCRYYPPTHHPNGVAVKIHTEHFCSKHESAYEEESN